MTEKRFIIHASSELEPEQLAQKLSEPCHENIQNRTPKFKKRQRWHLPWRSIIKRLLNRFPFLWRPARWLYNHLFINRILFTLRAQHDLLFSSFSQLERRLADMETQLQSIQSPLLKLTTLQKNIERLERQLQAYKLALEDCAQSGGGLSSETGSSSDSGNATVVQAARLEQFYIHFENRFRGESETIQAYQQAYLSFIPEVARHKPVLDIGCGRGEWLQALSAAGFQAEGIDLNRTMVGHCTEKGLSVTHGDGLQHVQHAPAGHYAAITAFHVVEHIPFAHILAFFEAAHHALDESGVLIVETPNPENLQVGAHTFWMDPTHIKPLPPALLAFAAEYVGFAKTHVARFHPYKKTLSSNPEIRDIQTHLYREQDYALIAWKSDYDA